MSRIVVGGYVVRFPLAGNAWAHLQYVLGLDLLGHDVWFVEDAGWEDACYDPRCDQMTSDFGYGMQFLCDMLAPAGLADRTLYRDCDGVWHGKHSADWDDIIAGADLFLDVGGSGYIPEMHRARHRAYVDMDPGFTQFGAFAHGRLDEYDTLFTYGSNVGQPGCSVPTLGLDWHPLLPPVLLNLWGGCGDAPTGAPWTTVGSWSAYGDMEYEGEIYGQKDVEFLRVIDLPQRVDCALELAVSGDNLPVDLLRSHGWLLRDSVCVSTRPERYREYIGRSRGEFSVAKNGYVKTRSGWLSDRTASYLAAGRPAVVQDTGLRGSLAGGCGLLSFGTVEEAAGALHEAEHRYAAHAEGARQLAETCLDARKVLGGLLEVTGV